MKNEYVTVKEASLMLGVTPLTIRNWDARGRLVAYRHPINNYRMFRRTDITAILADMKPRAIKKSGPRKLSVSFEEEIA